MTISRRFLRENNETNQLLNIYDENYELVVDFSKKFGQGRYKGSSLGDSSVIDWYWSVDHDDDVATWFGHIAKSRVNKKKLDDMIDDESFKIIKTDILRSDMSGVVRIFEGPRDLDTLEDIIISEMDELVYEDILDKDTAEDLKDELLSKLDKIFEDIVKWCEDDLVTELKKSKSVLDLLNIIAGETFSDIIWEATIEVIHDKYI